MRVGALLKIALPSPGLLAVLVAVACAGEARAQQWPGDTLPTPPINNDFGAGRSSDWSRISEDARAAAQLKDARNYIDGTHGYPRDGKKGCSLAKAAAPSRPDARTLEGDCYRYGWGGEKNPGRAARAYERAIDLDYAPARCALAALLTEQGVETERARTLCPSQAN